MIHDCKRQGKLDAAFNAEHVMPGRQSRFTSTCTLGEKSPTSSSQPDLSQGIGASSIAHDLQHRRHDMAMHEFLAVAHDVPR
eukprot:scaffold57610_cov34-Tisochrysis_lutea.AAC.1